MAAGASEVNLTENQTAALIAIGAGEIEMRKYGYGAWRISGPSHPSVVGKVIAMGLAEWHRHDGTKRAVLTEAGEAKVAALRP